MYNFTTREAEMLKNKLIEYSKQMIKREKNVLLQTASRKNANFILKEIHDNVDKKAMGIYESLKYLDIAVIDAHLAKDAKDVEDVKDAEDMRDIRYWVKNVFDDILERLRTISSQDGSDDSFIADFTIKLENIIMIKRIQYTYFVDYANKKIQDAVNKTSATLHIVNEAETKLRAISSSYMDHFHFDDQIERDNIIKKQYESHNARKEYDMARVCYDTIVTRNIIVRKNIMSNIVEKINDAKIKCEISEKDTLCAHTHMDNAQIEMDNAKTQYGDMVRGADNANANIRTADNAIHLINEAIYKTLTATCESIGLEDKCVKRMVLNAKRKELLKILMNIDDKVNDANERMHIMSEKYKVSVTIHNTKIAEKKIAYDAKHTDMDILSKMESNCAEFRQNHPMYKMFDDHENDAKEKMDFALDKYTKVERDVIDMTFIAAKRTNDINTYKEKKAKAILAVKNAKENHMEAKYIEILTREVGRRAEGMIAEIYGRAKKLWEQFWNYVAKCKYPDNDDDDDNVLISRSQWIECKLKKIKSEKIADLEQFKIPTVSETSEKEAHEQFTTKLIKEEIGKINFAIFAARIYYAVYVSYFSDVPAMMSDLVDMLGVDLIKSLL